ncbi:hypothetical protein Nit79A3_2429 [Nitrosomonas sp. Is79A3]|uniref:hypothetical protein n=1 Tax=Nitrosomonas sp. (strain Is79A3) TaxID=261292 RepID=UPI000215CADC
MKKLFLAVLLLAAASVQAAEFYVPTGVMAVYPGIVNEPYSAPLDNRLKFADKDDCDKAIEEIAKSKAIYVSTDNGTQRPEQDAATSIVVVAGACIKQSE